MGYSGDTYRVATTDTAVGISSSILSHGTVNGNTLNGSINSVTLVCETNPVRVAIGTPTQGATGVGILLAVGDAIDFDGYSDCAAVKWISATDGVTGSLQITPHYFGG
jgi:hypothetical protein